MRTEALAVATEERENASRLAVFTFGEVVDRTQTPRVFRIAPFVPDGTYGAVGGQDKAGKTIAVADMSVSVATGTPWMSLFQCLQGEVLTFNAEGGEASYRRKVEAVARWKGVPLSALHDTLRVCFRAPRLLDRGDVEAVRRELRERPADLVVFDGSYRSFAGARGSELYAMAAPLEDIQHVCEDEGSTLIVVAQWNKGGQGKGAERFTGVGLGAWARFLGSMSVEASKTIDGSSVVDLRWEFTGGEIAPTIFNVRRRMWVDDPDDPDSPLHYEVELIDAPEDSQGSTLKPSTARVRRAMEGTSQQEPITVREIGDRLAAEGKPLTARTIQKALNELRANGAADFEDDGEGTAARWWLR